MARKGLLPPNKNEQLQQPVIEMNQTMLVAFVGSAQSGKGTACSYLAGLIWSSAGLLNKYDIDDEGKLRIYDLRGYSFPKGQHLDVLDWNNTDEVDYLLSQCSPHPMNLIQKVAFADPLKTTISRMFGIAPQHLWGTDKEKGAESQYTANEFINLIGPSRWPFKDKNGSDKLTYREILQLFGHEIGQRIRPNLWVERTVENIYNIIGQWRPRLIVVEDVRYPHELESIKKMNGITIGLTRRPKSSAGVIHASEKNIPKLLEQCMYTIDNSKMDVREQCLNLFDIFNDVISSHS